MPCSPPSAAPAPATACAHPWPPGAPPPVCRARLSGPPDMSRQGGAAGCGGAGGVSEAAPRCPALPRERRRRPAHCQPATQQASSTPRAWCCTLPPLTQQPCTLKALPALVLPSSLGACERRATSPARATRIAAWSRCRALPRCELLVNLSGCDGHVRRGRCRGSRGTGWPQSTLAASLAPQRRAMRVAAQHLRCWFRWAEAASAPCVDGARSPFDWRWPASRVAPESDPIRALSKPDLAGPAHEGCGGGRLRVRVRTRCGLGATPAAAAQHTVQPKCLSRCCELRRVPLSQRLRPSSQRRRGQPSRAPHSRVAACPASAQG